MTRKIGIFVFCADPEGRALKGWEVVRRLYISENEKVICKYSKRCCGAVVQAAARIPLFHGQDSFVADERCDEVPLRHSDDKPCQVLPGEEVPRA